MGREAECEVRFGGGTARGKALLETTELVFRGGALRLKIPFSGVKAVKASDGQLEVRFADGTAVFALGAQAETWAAKIKNPPGRLDKLGVRPGMRVALIGSIEPAFAAEVEARGATVVGARATDVDLLFYALERPADLDRLGALKEAIRPAGAIWTVRAKGAAATVSEAAVMAAAKAAGLVDTKVASFSATHTAERLVIPLARR